MDIRAVPDRARSVIAAVVLAMASGACPAGGAEVTVYKDPNCGCCGKWAEHLRDNGFAVHEVPTRDMGRIKQQAGVPRALGSCHTAVVEGYVIEGHVPAGDVKRLLQERPSVIGLSAPGMPQGSPGMEGPYPPERYQVMSFDEKGAIEIFERH